MVAAVLLVLAIVVALAGVPFRRRLVSDPLCPDRTVLRCDVVITVGVGVLLAGAAVSAALGPELTGVTLVAGQIVAILTAALTGGSVVRVALATGGIPTRCDNYDDPETDPPLRGGRIIGVLERTAVAVCLLLGWPAGIAVLLGVKGLARFPQLREHHASEQFILGTFTSVLWACAAAGIGHLLAQ